MEQILSSEADSRSASQKFPAFQGTKSSITMSSRARH
jgi:hypothetical protein